MPAAISQSVLAAFDPATENELSAHAYDPLRVGFTDLPPGIQGGVAKLVKCRFEAIGKDSERKKFDGTSAVGEAQYVMVGIVVEPESIVHPKTGQVIRVAGQQFRPLPIPICDIKRGGKLASRTEMALRAMDDMKLLVNNEKLFPQKVTAQVLEQTAKDLEKRANDGSKKPIYFRFDTTQDDPTEKYPNPMVFQNNRGGGGLENYSPPSLNGKVQDDNHAFHPTNTVGTPTQAPPTQMTAPAQVAQAPETTVDPLAVSEPTVEELAALAGGDERLKEVRDAQMELMNRWKASGRSEQSFKDAATYTDIGNTLKTAPTSNGVAPATQPATGLKKDDTAKVKLVYTDPAGNAQTVLVDAMVSSVNADGTYDLVGLKNPAQKFTGIKKDDLV